MEPRKPVRHLPTPGDEETEVGAPRDDDTEAEQQQLGSTRVLSPSETPPPDQSPTEQVRAEIKRDQTGDEEDTAIAGPPQEPGEISVLGDFELLKKIGEGAMGAVFKARQRSFNREVALKVLFTHVADNPKLVERLYREGRVMGQLDHPNIVQAYGVDEDQGYHYVAMEYVDGDSLQKWLNRLGSLELGDALHITVAVARALEYAHKLGLVHRDIKPDNVLINRMGQIKVADLGMVKTADEDMNLTQTGHAVGTPWYMPLEQARNAKDTDGRCDIYAMGCMLYCMLTGNPPFVGRTIVEVIQAKEVGTFPTARSRNAEVPERLDLIIAKMTAKLPRYRYQTCAEVLQDLETLDLTNKSLHFLEGKLPKRNTGVKAAGPGSSSVDVDPDVWYVNIGHADGGSTLTKLTTSQIKKMLDEGSVKPTARASHSKTEGFRSLATYKEFQGSALSQVSKQAADAQGARFRSLMKKIEEKDREREEKEKSQERSLDPIAKYWQTLWLPSLYVAGGVLVLFFLWYIVSGLLK